MRNLSTHETCFSAADNPGEPEDEFFFCKAINSHDVSKNKVLDSMGLALLVRGSHSLRSRNGSITMTFMLRRDQSFSCDKEETT